MFRKLLEIHYQIHSSQKYESWNRYLKKLSWLFLFCAILLAILSLMDQILVFREDITASLFIGIFGVTLLAIASVNLVYMLKGGDLLTTARQLESHFPELKDSLNCTTEILLGTQRKFNRVETLMVEKLHQDLQNKNLRLSLVPQGNRMKSGSRFFLATLIFLASFFGDVFSKSSWFLEDFLHGENTYFLIEPGNTSIPRNTGLTVQVQLTRERRTEKPVYIVFRETGGEQKKYSMNPKRNNSFSFNFYEVKNSFTYWVENDVSRSPQFNVAIFDLPRYKSLEYSIKPPLYTGLEIRTVTEPENLVLPQNTEINIKMVTNKSVRVFLSEKAKDFPFSEDSFLNYSYSFKLEEYMEYALKLMDREGHIFQTSPDFIIECIPDLPPLVEIVSPPLDINVYGVEPFPIKFEARDDYGLTDLYLIFTMPAQPRQKMSLFLPYQMDKNSREISLQRIINLYQMRLQNGDLVSYHLEAVDNHKPFPQISRSEIHFFTVIPDFKAPDGKKDKNKKNPLEQMKAPDFRMDDLLAEQKRIYRASSANQLEPDPKRKREKEIVAANAQGDLQVQTSQRYNKLIEIAGQENLGRIGTLFEDSIHQMDIAEKKMREHLNETSMFYQYQALQNLNRILMLLMKDNPPAKGEGKSSKPQNFSPEEEEVLKEKQKELMKKLHAWMEKLDESRGIQKALNRKLERLNERLTVDQKKYFSQRETSLQEELKIIMYEMQSHKEVFHAADLIASAVREIKNEIQKIEQSQKAVAQKFGKKAERNLDAAYNQLKEILRKMTENEINKLISKARNLQKIQSGVSKETRDNPQGSPDKLTEISKKQQKISEELKKLKEEIEKAMEKLEDKAPASSRQLADSLEHIESSSLDRNIKKAAKSIFYGQTDKAEKYQKNVMKALSQLNDQLERAHSSLPEYDKKELMETLKKLGELFQNSQKKGEENAKKENDKNAEENLEKLKNILKNMNGGKTPKFLKDIVRNANELGQDKNSEENAGLTLGTLLIKAMTLIEARIDSMDLEKKFRKSLYRGQPPERYRKMVEEYFKNLSRKK